ncbi:MAG: T9SS type A sorting domain-containing protein [Spirosomataceae bacterium]
MKRFLFQKWLFILLCMCTGVTSILHAQFLNPDRRTIENNKICNDPIVGTGVTSPATPTGLSVCVLCGSEGANVVDGDISNFGNVTLLDVNALGAALVVVRDGLQYYPAGNRVGFVVRSTASLLQANLLSGLEIQTFRNGTLVNTANTSGSVLSLGAVGSSNGKQIISFITTADFDEVRLVSRGLVNAAALGGLAVYYAFEEPASCQVDCSTPLTGTLTTGTPVATGTAIICPAVNPANVTDVDPTNATAGTLGVAASLLCEPSFLVRAATSYSAGTEVGFVIGDPELLGLVPATLLAGITVEAINSPDDNITAGEIVTTKTGANLVSANLLGSLLGGSGARAKIGLIATGTFNKVRITLGGIATTLSVYSPYIILDADSDGVPDCRDGCANASFTDTDGDGLFDPCDNNTANLTVTMTSSPASPVALNSNVTFTTTVTETGANATTGVIVTEVLSPGLTYVSHVAPPGTSYDPVTGIWTIGSALLGDPTSLSLQIVATVTQTGISTNTATVSLPTGQTNTSSSPSSSACVSVTYQICQGQSQVLTATTGEPYQWFKDGIQIPGAFQSTYTATATGTYSTNPTCTTGSCCYYVNVNTSPTATVSAAPGNGAGNAACLSLNGTYPVSLTLGNCAGGTFTVYQTKNGTETTLASNIAASPYNFNLTAAAAGNTTDTYTFKATCSVNGCEGTKSTASSAITLTTQPGAPAAPVASAGTGAGTASCLPVNGTYPVSLALGSCPGGTFTVFQTKNGTKTTLATGVAANPYTFNLTASANSNTTDNYTFSASCTINGCTSAESTASNTISLTTQPAAPPAPTATTVLTVGELLCLNLGAIVPVTVNVLGSCPGGTISLYRTKNGVVTEQLTFIPGLPLLDNLTASSSTDVYVYSAVCTVNGCSSPQSPLSANLTLSTNCNGADLQITNSVLPSNPTLNQNVTFTTTVSENAVNSTATNVAVTETFTNGLVYVSHVAPPGTGYDPLTGIWTIGAALTPAEVSSLTLTIVMTVANPGVSTNTATITSGDPVGNSSSTVCVSVPYQICTGGSVVLTAPTAGQWYRNGVLILGATGNTYTATQGGSYTNTSLAQALNCANNCCFEVTEIQATAPTITAAAAPGNNLNATCLPPGTDYPITLTLGNCAGGTFTIYQSKNGGAETVLATGVTTSPYSLTLTASANPATTDTYVFSATCSVSNCSSSRSASSTITLSTQPSAPSAPTVVTVNLTIDQLLCLNVGAIVPVTITPNGSCPGGVFTIFRTQNGVRTQVLLGLDNLTVSSTTDVYAYSVVCTINGCSSPDSPTATVTLSNKPPTPTFTNSIDAVCSNTMTTITVGNCPNGSVIWSTGQTTNAPPHSITVQAPATGSTDITATCKIGLLCTSDPGTFRLVSKPFNLTIINVGQSQVRVLPGTGHVKEDWAPFVVPSNMPLDLGTEANRAMFNISSYPAPRYWTIVVELCDNTLPVRSIAYYTYLVDNAGAILRSYNTVENNPPYLMFGNSGFNGLYTLDSPTWGFYSETETYSSGFPEGNYNLHIKAKSLPGVDYGPYPANVTRNEAGNTLVDKVYYFKIGTAAGRVGVSEKLSDETNFATVAPNPVTRTLTTVIKGAKGQPVKLNLTDITGRVLMQRDVVPTTNDHREEVDVSGQATGVYLMQVVSPTKKASLKVVKIPND